MVVFANIVIFPNCFIRKKLLYNYFFCICYCHRRYLFHSFNSVLKKRPSVSSVPSVVKNNFLLLYGILLFFFSNIAKRFLLF